MSSDNNQDYEENDNSDVYYQENTYTYTYNQGLLKKTWGQRIREFVEGLVLSNTEENDLPPMQTIDQNGRGAFPTETHNGNEQPKIEEPNANSSSSERLKKKVKRVPSNMKENENKPFDDTKPNKSPQDMRKKPQNEKFKDTNSTYLAPEDSNDSPKKGTKVRKKKSRTSTEVYFAPYFEI